MSRKVDKATKQLVDEIMQVLCKRSVYSIDSRLGGSVESRLYKLSFVALTDLHAFIVLGERP